MKYELGKYDACADAHGKSIIDEMLEFNPDLDMKNGTAHSVVVCVYADGFLQFAGGNAGWMNGDRAFPRHCVKEQAFGILERFNPQGMIEKQGGEQ